MREAIAQKTFEFALQDQIAPAAVPTGKPVIAATSEPVTEPATYGFHLYAKQESDAYKNFSSHPVTKDSDHNSIQVTWSQFTSMSDSQRNQMLKGIIHRCSSKQIEYICTILNLKMVETSTNPIQKIMPSEVASKFPFKKIAKAANALNPKLAVPPIQKK